MPVETPDPALVPASNPGRSARFWKRAFLVSLALNLLVAGVIGGAIIKGPPPPARMVRDLGFGTFAGALSEADRKALRQEFLRQGGMHPPAAARHIQVDQAAILQALRADPFDAAGLERALAQQQGRMQQQFALGQKVLFSRLAQMSTRERLDFADRLERSLQHMSPSGRQGSEGRGKGEGRPSDGPHRPGDR